MILWLLFSMGLLLGFALGVFVAYPQNTIVRDPKECHKLRVKREKQLLKMIEDRDKVILHHHLRIDE